MYNHVKVLWIDALMSGKYPQTRGALQNDYGYCCLGVLCDVAAKNGVNVTVEYREDEQRYAYDWDSYDLPETVREWAGLDSCDPEILDEPLSTHNDHLEESFVDIAKLIHDHL